MVIKMGNYSSFKNVRLVLLSSKGPLHSNQIKLTIMRFTSPYHYWASTERNSFLDVPLRISSISLPPNTHTAIRHMEKKPTFIRPVNFSPRPDIPVPALLAPIQTRCLLSRSKHWSSDRPTSTITRSPEPITNCSGWQCPVWQPSLLHNSTG